MANANSHPDRRPSRGPSLVRTIPYPPRARLLRVTRVKPLSPSMRRIVLGGRDLESGFPFPTLGSADHVKLAFPDPVTGVLNLPQVRRGERGPEVAGSTPPLMREYTIRSVDRAAAELTIDFVVHEHGPAGRWAAAASIGATIGVLGPRGSRVYPGSCADYLFVVDETGLPAVERFLEELPPHAPATVVALVPEGSVRTLGGRRPARTHWLTDDGDPARAADAILTSASRLAIGPDTFVWGAGEASVIRALRTHLQAEGRIDPEHVVLRGYWRHGLAGAPPAEEDQ